MSTERQLLFEPVGAGRYQLPHRIVMAPLTRSLHPGNVPSPLIGPQLFPPAPVEFRNINLRLLGSQGAAVAISLRTTTEIPWHKRPEVALVTGGVEADVLGDGLGEIPAADRDAVVAAYRIREVPGALASRSPHALDRQSDVGFWSECRSARSDTAHMNSSTLVN